MGRKALPHNRAFRDQLLAALRAEGPLTAKQLGTKLTTECTCARRHPTGRALRDCRVCGGDGLRRMFGSELNSHLYALERAGEVTAVRAPREENIWAYVQRDDVAADDEAFRDVMARFRDS